jgi:hypothetical protein
MATHRTDFEIDASDEQVWAVLVDFASYPDWNPSVPSISGDLRAGSTVSLTLALPGRPNLDVKAQLRDVTPNRLLTWRGNLGADRLFTGYREFAIDPLSEDKVRVTHVEDLRGLLAPVFEALMGRPVQRHHEAFDDSLKRRAEGIAAQAASES